MASLWKVDTKTFMRLFVVFNVSLAVYNFLSFRIGGETRSPMAPCVMVVNSGDQNQAAYVVVPNTSTLDSEQAAKLKNVDGSGGGTVAHLNSNSTVNSQTAAGPLLKGESKITRRGHYFVLPNYIPANRTYVGEESVTLTTQGTSNFLKHAVILCRRWGGPVSLSVYVGSGGRELTRALRIVAHLRRCHECVHRNVSWHLIFESDGVWHVSKNNASFERHQLEADAKVPSWVDLEPSYNCTAMENATLNFKNATREAPRKLGRGYPINVARNVARTMATTKYVLASDIELYPSLNVIPRFLKMVASQRAEEKASANGSPRVYVFPIFEVSASEAPPENKTTLVKLLREKKAIYFHKWTCDSCQNFPGRPTWPDVIPNENDLGIHQKSKRDRTRNSWEPIYIGTNGDPLYEEQLTWEGKRDKMSQMYEMCLMNYTLYILDNAFLVHAPGIKTINISDEKRRGPFMRKNNVIYERSLSRIRKKYPNYKKTTC